MANATPDDLWSPFKYLQSSVDAVLSGSQGVQAGNVYKLDSVLRQQKQNFCSLLRNPPKNDRSREEVKRGITDGVTLPGLGHTILSKPMVDESLIISDMYNLNEQIAMLLLFTAQQQMPLHPGLPRGLVAVLLYYDGRKAIVSTLKELFQARNGISWCTDVAPEVIQTVTQYTDHLVQEGILDRIVELLEQLDFSHELETLTANRALGNAKHYRQVVDLFQDIRLLLALCLFNWSAQCGLPKRVTLRLIDLLAKYSPNDDARGGLDNVTATLLMALLYALDVSVLQKREDGEELVKRLPIISEPGFIDSVLDRLTNTSTAWQCDGLRCVAMFTLSVTLATLRLAPQNLQPSAATLEQDDSLCDSAIQGKVFDFLHCTVLENEFCYEQEFIFRRLHVLITDFIEYSHSKVTELRARADETARTVAAYQQQNIEPPSTVCRAFEMLLLTVGKLYAKDKLQLGLSLDYWGPMELPTNYQRSSSRSVSLFKFIRLAGELLPPTLFVPYLKMLAGLANSQQSAQNAFNLLKQGTGGGGGGGGGSGGVAQGSTTITWDHFFSSLAQYYTNLRVDQYPTSDTVYRNTSRSISPMEIAGLHAVLGVIKAVAEQDEVARIAICDQPSWAPMQVMLGLISCSVPITFKSELFLTLAALAKSKRTANQLWNYLESSQVIVTMPSINKFQSQGIETEIEQNELRNESYPLSQAVLEMVYALVSTSEPNNLGAGARRPGLEPYLQFVVNAIFLKFNSRNYKDAQEKWRLGEKCLRILSHFVRTYQVNPKDFSQHEQNVPCGFHVLLKINSDSEELKLLLSIVDEAVCRLDTYTSFVGKAELEQCALHCLNILERALQIQNLFIDAHHAANSSVWLGRLNKLLLGVNARTGKADHMLNVTKFVMYKSWLPQHTLAAVKVLTYVARQPNVNAQLLGVLTGNERLKAEIRYGFVESLEGDAVAAGGDDSEVEEGENVEVEIKMQIVQLLQECLPQSAPNLTHYLLGFDITKDIRKTCLQQPGVMDFPSTCIKSLITILDNHLDAIRGGEEPTNAQNKLVEAAYHLLYSLCLNVKTSEVILRFLRSCNDFLGRHLSELPFDGRPNARVLNQMTGLLKCVAIEAKQIAANNHLSQFGNLCKILLGTGVSREMDPMMMQQGKSISLELSYYTGNDQMQGQQRSFMRKAGEGERQQRLLVTQLLDCVEFETRGVERPRWEFLDNSQLDGLFKSCLVSRNGTMLIDIKRLNDVLRQDWANARCNMPVGHVIAPEIKSVLQYAQEVNQQKSKSVASAKFLEAWGQAVEIVVSVAPSACLSVEHKQTLILEILQVILKKVIPIEMLVEFSNLISSTVLILLVNLRSCYLQAAQEAADDSLMTMNQSAIAGKIKSVNSLNLKFILRNIVEWIIVSGAGTQKLKINLYACFLNAMYIVKQNAGPDGEQEDEQRVAQDDSNYVSRLDKTVGLIGGGGTVSGRERFVAHMSIVAEVFMDFGDKLLDALCHDSIGGHEVCRMLSLDCINIVLSLDTVDFTELMAKRGYLSVVLDSLHKADKQLCVILEAQPDNLKALYVYESLMAMLGRVAESDTGAELLLEHRLLGIMATMRCFDLHPDFQMRNVTRGGSAMGGGYASHGLSFIPSVEVIYQQILFPALRLCDTVLTTMGKQNRSAVSLVVQFLLSHVDMIEVVLRAGSPHLNLGLLKELSSLTGLIARTTSQQLLNFSEPNASQDIGAHLFRLQKLMLSLFPRFILKEFIVQEIRKEEQDQRNEGGKTPQHSEQMAVVLQISANLVMYARNAIANHSADHRVIRVLFSPSLSEGVQRADAGNVVSPNLGVVIAQLKAMVRFYAAEKVALDSLQRQIGSLSTVHLENNARTQQKLMRDRLQEKRNELKLCVFIVEHCLYLLWAHLDYYMLRAVPVDPLLGFNQNFSSLDTQNVLLISGATSEAAGWRAMSEDIVVLKKHLISVFNETFCNQLVATTQDQSTTEKSFVEALLRRIKRLIQFVPVN